MNWKINRNGIEEVITIKKVGFLKPSEIWLGNELLGTWPKSMELRKGFVYTAKDGSKLELKMKSFPMELQVKFNGQPVMGTAAHPDNRIKVAYIIMTVVCLLNLIIGSTALITNSASLQGLGFGAYNLIVGGMFLILLLSGYNEKKFWPLLLGLGIFCFDAVMMVQSLVALKMAPNVGPIIVRMWLIIPWVKGCLESYKKNKAKESISLAAK